ncbi:hypothetical protein BV25DRAFT_1136666 [Artomyces pyxidatus]|uniref:Uncharacterized protein n=1 Tax=Artomyces pyxidatus TaxID=48021 RepID=A0ACB8STJ8_9AGAM|nr:hypothetical protein BV25DRAFT_1136666 [Artomyces pyxidatus]
MSCGGWCHAVVSRQSPCRPYPPAPSIGSSVLAHDSECIRNPPSCFARSCSRTVAIDSSAQDAPPSTGRARRTTSRPTFSGACGEHSSRLSRVSDQVALAPVDDDLCDKHGRPDVPAFRESRGLSVPQAGLAISRRRQIPAVKHTHNTQAFRRRQGIDSRAINMTCTIVDGSRRTAS